MNLAPSQSWIPKTHRPIKSAILSLAIILLAIILLPSIAGVQSAQAQTLTILHSFGSMGDGGSPNSGVIRDSAGNLYGTTYAGGSPSWGTVFELDTSGTETVLHTFTGGSGDGAFPVGGLVLDASGNLYGPTQAGGTSNSGTVFEVSEGGVETVLYSFAGGKDGNFPNTSLLLAAGSLLGTTYDGGYSGDKDCGSGCGTLFRLNVKTQKKTLLHAFTGPPKDGSYPSAIARDTKGNIYAVTYNGGDGSDNNCTVGGCGTVLKFNTSDHETVLHSFTGSPDGWGPVGLVLDGAGNIYGVTYSGGNSGSGTIFKLSATGTESVLYNFTGGTDGSGPTGGLVRDKEGNLYGATTDGGDPACSCGTIFKLDTADTLTVLHTFQGGRVDGAYPSGGLAMDSAGNLYGTTGGGSEFAPCSIIGCGIVFELTQ